MGEEGRGEGALPEGLDRQRWQIMDVMLAPSAGY